MPRRAEYIRVLSAELNRIASHSLFLGWMALDLGGLTPILWSFIERDEIVEMLASLTGQRMLFNYFRIGGVNGDLSHDFMSRLGEWMGHATEQIEAGQTLLNENEIFVRRMRGLGTIDTDAALRTAADALACDALGAVVLEIWGEARQLDLVASRKLTLAAQASGVTALLLRMAAPPRPSTAETRWIVRAAHSPPSTPWSAWGAPVFDAQLVRNRHGPVGRWIMEWKCDECLFSEPASYPQSVAATPARRPHQAAAYAGQRRAS